MKVFISWSGARSKSLAVALKDWLPLILQYAKPWVSDKDISAGERWAQSIAGELEASNFGILCITPENIKSEWILFEAGALSKSMLDSKVIPLLFGLELSDLSGPLQQFQASKVDQQGMFDVVKAIDAVSETKAAEGVVDQLVPALWPQLQRKLAEIPQQVDSEKNVRPQKEVLEDLVSQVRSLSTRIRDFDPEFVDKESRYTDKKMREFHPAMVDEFSYLLNEMREGEINLLVLAGLLRDQMPWVVEVLIEAYRELRSANPKQAREIGERLVRVVAVLARGPFADKALSRSKYGQFWMMELPHLVERAIANSIEGRPAIGTIQRKGTDAG